MCSSDLAVVQVSDQTHQIATSVCIKVPGQGFDGLSRGFLETRSQRQVLNGVARERHLGCDKEIGAGAPSLVSHRSKFTGIASKITNGRVALGQRQTKMGHGSRVAMPRQKENRPRNPAVTRTGPR